MSHYPEIKVDGVFLVRGTVPIEGVRVHPLRRIADERGTVFHMLRKSDPHFMEFGEIYFSSVYAGVVKGWHKHNEMSLHYACVHGRIKCALYDDRDGSPSKGSLMEVYLGPDSYHLLVVPPLVWNGFKGMGPENIVANACTHSHDPKRSFRLPPDDPSIGYDWATKHH
jgi:dTDP-4-dehydrorhamnose 3,5-epimerase